MGAVFDGYIPIDLLSIVLTLFKRHSKQEYTWNRKKY
ncbi:hypothetical protein JOC73_003023 [Alkaliphilus hydrothermalis]|uniref:Uncharacterized protein n=1 Tax=Alkaliphilus hydrothermalis TaxID=1482730 RepID=A0ABS2NTZ3_9FIRM|nr:hypothetical protein [Alkaliphilus hydrothermalis]